MIAAVVAVAMTLAPGACEAPAAATQEIQVKLNIVRSEGISLSKAKAFVDGASRVLAPFQITLDATHAKTKVEGPAFASRSAHPEAKSARAAIRLSMDPVRHFVAEHASAPVVTVWLLPNITAPDARMRRILRGEPPGFTLVNRSKTFGAFAGLHDEGALVLLSTSAGADGRTLAHELGHAAGLEHREGEGALMATQPSACPPALNAKELARFQALGTARPKQEPSLSD